MAVATMDLKLLVTMSPSIHNTEGAVAGYAHISFSGKSHFLNGEGREAGYPTPHGFPFFPYSHEYPFLPLFLSFLLETSPKIVSLLLQISILSLSWLIDIVLSKPLPHAQDRYLPLWPYQPFLGSDRGKPAIVGLSTPHICSVSCMV